MPAPSLPTKECGGPPGLPLAQCRPTWKLCQPAPSRLGPEGGVGSLRPVGCAGEGCQLPSWLLAALLGGNQVVRAQQGGGLVTPPLVGNAKCPATPLGQRPNVLGLTSPGAGIPQQSPIGRRRDSYQPSGTHWHFLFPHFLSVQEKALDSGTSKLEVQEGSWATGSQPRAGATPPNLQPQPCTCTPQSAWILGRGTVGSETQRQEGTGGWLVPHSSPSAHFWLRVQGPYLLPLWTHRGLSKPGIHVHTGDQGQP